MPKDGTGTPVDVSFRMQAKACRELGSPFLGRLLALAAERLPDESGALAARIRDWPGDPTQHGDSVPLRFAAGLHALVLSGAAPELAGVFPPRHAAVDDRALWAAVAGAMAGHEPALMKWLDSPPQTNEVRRSAALYLGLMAVARETGLPVVLSEIGASGGLNLNLDRYRYRFGETETGTSDSTVVLAPEWRGPPPVLAPVSVAARRGCDIRPIDLGDSRGRLRLMSYLWPDQSERLALTESALVMAVAYPVTVERRDAADFVAARLSEPAGGYVRVVAHSIMWQYLPAATRDRIAASIREAGAAASPSDPVAWVRLEPDGAEPGAAITVTLWPGGEEHLLARCDYHGRWIERLGGEAP